MECNVSGMNRGEVGRLGSRYGFVGNAGDLELDAPLNREPV